MIYTFLISSYVQKVYVNVNHYPWLSNPIWWLHLFTSFTSIYYLTKIRPATLMSCSYNHLLNWVQLPIFIVVSSTIPLLLLWVLMCHFLTHIFLLQSEPMKITLSYFQIRKADIYLVEIWQDLSILTILKSFNTILKSSCTFRIIWEAFTDSQTPNPKKRI